MKKNLISWLLLLLVVVNAIILIYIDNTFIRYIAGFIQVIILPGFLLLKVMISENRINFIWRWSLTFPLSLAIVSLILLIINYFFIYDYQFIIVIISTLNFIFISIWIFQKQTTVVRSNGFQLPKFPKYTEFKKLIPYIFLIASILFFAISILSAFVLPKKSQYFTEFYIITDDKTLPYTLSLSTNNILSFKLGITNNESNVSDYQIVLKSGDNMFIISDLVHLRVGDNRLMNFEIPIPKNLQSNEVEFLLNLNGKPFPYRKLKIFLNSEPPGTSQN
jgi:uncharacterized membrane protein